MAISSLFASAARLRSGSRRGWVAAAVVGVVLWSSGCTPRGDQDAGGAPHGEDAGEAKGKLKRLDTGRAGAPTQPAKGHAANPTPTSPKKDATTAKLTGEVEGDGVTGSYAGIPFPMPKNGYEAIWNTYLHFQPVYTDLRGGCYLMDSSGGLTETANVMTVTSTPYYDDKQSKLSDGYYEKYSSILYEPATQSGQKVAKFYTANFSQQDEQSWLYMPGQRRVRVAPEFKYDTPIAQVGGALFFDELYGMSGRLDRFDFALKGKKEMIVPYNDYGLASADVNSVAGTKHLNPEKVRWELHRVWVVDATLKADKRHAFSRRTFYIDEDSWTISTTESYDNNHQIERVYYTFPIFYYEKNLGGVGTQSFAVYDLLKGSYYLNNFNVGSGSNHLFVKDKILNPQQFTPVGLAGSGIS